MAYTFHWKEEALWALAFAALYIGGSFVVEGDMPLNEWGDWALTTGIAAARVAIAGLVKAGVQAFQTAGRNTDSLPDFPENRKGEP